MTAISRFDFTPRGKAARRQEVHKAKLRFIRGDEGRERLEIHIETTRPGETPDDRGVEGWDSRVLIDVTTDPLTPPQAGATLEIANALAGEKYAERFLYYWDHEDFTAARLVIRAAAGGWEVGFDGVSEAGDRVGFEAFMTA